MKAVVQRVDSAEVSVSGKVTGKIGCGFLVYLGIEKNDDMAKIEKLVSKITAFRIFRDENDRMNRNIADAGGSFLIISQFTLASDPFSGGNRPGFDNAMESKTAEKFYLEFVKKIKERGFKAETGVFGAHMSVKSVNDGPATFVFSL